MLEVKNLLVYYGLNEAVHGVNFNLKAGQIISLIGSNGAGKTSTLNAIIGMVKKKGEVFYNGKNIIKAKTHNIVRSGLALVPEGRRVFINLSVEENIKIGAFNNMSAFDELLEKMYKLFPRLEHKRKALAGTLSGGEAQMLAIARALMSQPKLLMLDEPSLGLAPKVVSEVFSALKELNESGLSILLVEQNAFLALKSSNYTYVLENGHISLEGKSSELIGDDEIRRKYLGA
ncbi:MAG: high-affinity branched-chain amino acid ABC transporter, ATP-binding protein [Candidatus Campylobacter infans]|nr:MAG: high-affinity branched-chain amino acid ABC transporter, ATP-binding protein [Candidatus Campylobacter infans]